MAKLRLGILNSSSIDKSYGGIAPFIKNLDPYLRKAFDVTYIVLPDKLYNIHFIPRRLIYMAYLAMRWKRLKGFDLILSHVPEGSFIVSFGSTPMAHIFHGNFNPMSQSRYWYGKYFKSVFSAMERRIISKAVLMRTVGTERPGIPKIYNPISHKTEIKPIAARRGFIFSGRLEKIKNVDRIIEIYSKLPDKIQEQHTLYIAGMGTQEASLKELAASLSIKGEVVFLGNLKNEDLIEEDSTKRILLMASSQEGFPMAIAEAFSLALPVISTDTGDISSFLKSGYNGFLLPLIFDDKEYVTCIESVLNDYDKFSQNAYRSFQPFRAEEVSQALIQDINKAVLKNENPSNS